MATAAQQKANQANSQHSTGPKTEEGKQRAAANSQKHGLCSKKLIVAPHEAGDFSALESQLRRELRPDGAAEESFFQTLLHAHWDQLRIRQHLANFQATQPDLVDDAKAIKTYERLRRYAATADRAFKAAYKELKALQVVRVHQVLSLNPTERNMPMLAATVIIKNTKRTQFPPLPFFPPDPDLDVNAPTTDSVAQEESAECQTAS